MTEKEIDKERPAFRAWINQPSALQPLHRDHGIRVLAVNPVIHGGTDTIRIYFLDGVAISEMVPIECLSKGWNRES